MKQKDEGKTDVAVEIELLREQLAEAKETLRAIQHGEVDALVVSTLEGEQVFVISGAEKPYRMLIEKMKEGAVMLSDDNTILYCNSGFADMVKYRLDQIIGVNFQYLVSLGHLESFEELLFLGRAGKGVREKEVTLQAKDNTLVPTLISINSIVKDNFKITFLVIVNLTQHMQKELIHYTNDLEIEIAERKKTEKKLENYKMNLERLVEERTRQLQEKERFAVIGQTAGMVGHDIRNPLQAIISDLYLAKTELASTPDSEEKKNALENLQEIEKNIDYINKIVADLQDFARSLNPRMEKTDLKLVIDDLLIKSEMPDNVEVSVK